MTSSALGVIAGTGFAALDELVGAETVEVVTAYGSVEATVGQLHGRRTVFLARHRRDHSLPPHLVNYRANIQALVDLGVTDVLAVNVVGGIGVDTGRLVVVDDFLDFTRGRISTYFDGGPPDGVVHVDMSDPYDDRLRQVWLDAAEATGSPALPSGVYAAFEGPRFETRAEIRMAQMLGATVVGMTGVPEVVLAKERGLPYASLCLVVNPAAGLGQPITLDGILDEIDRGARAVQAVITEAARRLSA